MADLKISQLNSIVTVVPATDVLPVVQGGTTLKITPKQILESGSPAVLASAAITGAATVGTTLGVTGVSTLTGAVGIGATPIGKFDVYTTASDTNIFVRSDTTRLGQIVFKDNADAANQGIVRYDHLNDRLSFTANGAENLYLLSTGDLSVQTGNVVMATSGKGIDFSATSGTGTSEILADYEEGTWSPTPSGGGNLTSQVSVSARYTKVGRLVTLSGYFTATVTLPNIDTYFVLPTLPFANGTVTTGSVMENASYKVGVSQVSASNLYGFFPAASAITAGAKDFYYSITYSV